MRTRLAGWLVVVGVLVGAGMAGHHLSDRPMLAAQSGTSTSAGGGGGGGTDDGSGGDGSSGTSGDGGSAGGGGGGTPAPTPTPPAPTSLGGGGSPAPAPTATSPTAPSGGRGGGGAGAGSGSATRQGDNGPDGGSSGFSPADDGGSEHDDEPYTLQPPTTEPAPERRQVAPGHKTDCPADTPAEVRCFGVDDWGDADAVEVPDGAGGTVVVPLVADVDTHVEGTSVSGGSNVDLRVHINVTDGTVVDVDRRADNTTQAVLLTLAVILLVFVLVGMGATLLRLQAQGLGG